MNSIKLLVLVSIFSSALCEAAQLACSYSLIYKHSEEVAYYPYNPSVDFLSVEEGCSKCEQLILENINADLLKKVLNENADRSRALNLKPKNFSISWKLASAKGGILCEKELPNLVKNTLK
jgi:hypothetical protein